MSLVAASKTRSSEQTFTILVFTLLLLRVTANNGQKVDSEGAVQGK